MKWSWKIGEFRGIGVYVHATFLILIGFIVLSHWSAGSSLGMRCPTNGGHSEDTGLRGLVGRFFEVV